MTEPFLNSSKDVSQIAPAPASYVVAIEQVRRCMALRRCQGHDRDIARTRYGSDCLSNDPYIGRAPATVAKRLQ
jgi:hypothetical protein